MTWGPTGSDRLELMIVIEDRFADVEITDDDVDRIDVVGDLIRHIESKRRERRRRPSFEAPLQVIRGPLGADAAHVAQGRRRRDDGSNGPDLPRGDVLIVDDRIAAIAADLPVPDGAEVIDASDMIVLPGLINAHVHTWQSALRGVAADWTVAQYMQAMHRGLATHFRPEDIYIANLMGALNQINSGSTTLVDWCHNNPTPAHTDAAIQGLQDAGIRAVFLHGSPKPDPKPGQKHFSEIPMPRAEVERLRKGRFADDLGPHHLRLGDPRAVLLDLRGDAAGRPARARIRPDRQHACRRRDAR